MTSEDKSRWQTRLLTLTGTLLYVGMMAAGYYYNLTFVQLGLVDLGQRILGMSRIEVAVQMAILAIVTCLVALICGWWMSKQNMGLVQKLRLAFVVIVIQSLLTPLAQRIDSTVMFTAWILGCSLTLGVGVPVTFSMAVDLVPRCWRGTSAALITSLAYLAANLLPASWTIEEFTRPFMVLLPAGAAGLAVFAFLRIPLVEKLATQQQLPEFSTGRYVKSMNRSFQVLIILMFGVFFVDSLGFLRLLETPRFMDSAWQSSDIEIRLLIGLVHVGTALIGGILYDALDVQELFFWIFGLFALTHLMYTLSLRTSESGAPLIQPVLYATAVSLYTVINFAIWADLSTPKTIARHAAIGVAVSGWTATFLSTALAIAWAESGLPLERHLNIVDTIAMLFFLILVIQFWLLPKNSVVREVR